MAFFDYNGCNVYYRELGQGPPLFLLHGNSVSSKLFDFVTGLYSDDYRLVLIDFAGHGRSDRLDAFPADFWYDEAMQVVRLIEHMQYGKANLIGTSGGALAALNVALERADLVNRVIADSFEGEQAFEAVVRYLPEERRLSKAQERGRAFWEYCHGPDWEAVVDSDTAVCQKHFTGVKRFFHKDLAALAVPAMLTASLDDEFAKVARLDFGRLYPAMASKIKGCRVHIFPSGAHPAMLTNAGEFAAIAKAFLSEGVS